MMHGQKNIKLCKEKTEGVQEYGAEEEDTGRAWQEA